jgi:O-antigen/teichoic acid export membrane protein
LNNIRRSFFFSLAQNYTVIGIQFVNSVVIARLLTPADIGIFSVSMVLVGFAQILRDFGVGEYIIQEKDLTRDRIRTAFGLALLLAWLMGLTLLLAAGPAAEFYREAGVRHVMYVLSFSFVLIPFGTITQAYLRRELEFGAIYQIKALSTLVSAATSVCLACTGFGYLSMAWGLFASNIATIILTAYHRPAGFPMLPGLAGARRVVSFGGMVSAATMLAEINRGAPDLILGRFVGMSAVGLFGRAMGLIDMFHRVFMNSVWMVALPHFSQQRRDGHDIAAGFLKSVNYLTVIAWPFFIFLALMAYPIVRILYGSQWDASVPLVKLFCIYAVFLAPFYVAPSVLLALGQAKKHMDAQLVLVLVKVVVLVIVAPYGVDAVALAVILSGLIGGFVYYAKMRSSVGLNVAGFVHAMTKSSLVTICSAVGPAMVLVMMPIGPEHVWLPLIAAAALAALGWLGGVFGLGHPIKEEIVDALAKSKTLLGRHAVQK